MLKRYAMKLSNNFEVICYESGQSSAVPLWACKNENPLNLGLNKEANIVYKDINTIPAGFHLLNVLSNTECDDFIELTNTLNYGEDSSISLSRSVRHNQNLVWVIDQVMHDILWNRVQPFMHNKRNLFDNKAGIGLNKRFRFYKYEVGDFFKTHTDGAWFGSAIVDGKLIDSENAKQKSRMTFLLFLSDDYIGGETQFLVNSQNSSKPATNEKNMNKVQIQTPKGSVLCFAHGHHAQHCLHSSLEIVQGVKYIIRTDVLFD